ncbi:MAG: TolC family protein [Hyphomonas sp.]|nr:TolC family protein [Hyphomonas sp.]
MRCVYYPASICIAAIVLAGCATAPPGPTMPDVPVEGAYLSETAGLSLKVDWWKQFDDPTLDALIEQSLSANKSLEQAAANIRVSEALASGARLDRSYSAFTSLGGDIGRTARPGQDVNVSVQGELGASWEFDAFGRIEAQIAAAEFDIEAARQARRDIAVIVVSETARNYVQLRGAQRRLAVARKNAETQSEGLDLLQTLFENGRATRLDMERAEAQYRTTLASLPRYEAAIQSSRSALAALTAQPANAPSGLVSELVAGAADIPEHRGAIMTGSVEDLVRRRPDIRGAEAAIARQLALGEAARADLFPTITVNANVLALFDDTNDIGDLTSFGFGIGPSIRWAGPDLRRVRANIEASDARSEAVIAQYEQTVLNALSEVEAALSEYTNELKRRDDLQRAAASAQRAIELARLRFEEGLDDYLDVLEAQRTLLTAEDQLAESRLQSSNRAIAAYRALGGIEMPDEYGMTPAVALE